MAGIDPMALMSKLEEAKNPSDDVDDADEEAKAEASKCFFL